MLLSAETCRGFGVEYVERGLMGGVGWGGHDEVVIGFFRLLLRAGFSKSLAFLREGREGFGVLKGGGEFVAD